MRATPSAFVRYAAAKKAENEAKAESKDLREDILTYFDEKGSHVQFNVVSRETLLDAQKHPENYKTLVVFFHLNKSMCIFHDIDDLQYNAIINKKYKDITL